MIYSGGNYNPSLVGTQYVPVVPTYIPTLIVDVPDSYGQPDGFVNTKELEDAFEVSLPYRYKILVAWIGTAFYEETAFILFSCNDKLWEVNAYHCSCYGFEGQWLAERTSVAALRKRAFEFAKSGDSNPLRDKVMDELRKWERRKSCEGA